MSEDPRPGSTADLVRRVERLEATMADQSRDLGIVQTEQRHLRELVSSGFATVNATLMAVSSKVETLTAAQQLSTVQQQIKDRQSIGTARLLAMAASTAVIAGAIVGVILQLT